MGSRKGCKNIKNFDAMALATAMGVDPVEILLMVAAGDWKGLGFETKSKIVYTPQGIEMEEDHVKLSDRVQAAKESAKYIYSTKQSVAVSTGESGIKIIVEDYSKK